MSSDDVIDYIPPPTAELFIKHYLPGELFYSWITGPVGSGKTVADFFKLIYMAGMQKPGKDGIRRTRCVIVRNTLPQLRDTTMKSWEQWFREGVYGKWRKTENAFDLKFGDVECEVLFRPLDTADDVARVLSLEVTFAIIDEFVNVPRAIIMALSGRCGRYPAKRDGGATNWGMWGASNTDTEDNWWFDYLHEGAVRIDAPTAGKVFEIVDLEQPDRVNARHFVQPSGFSPDAENLENLPGGARYYINQAVGKTKAWIKQFIEVEWGFSVAGQPVVPSFNPEIHLAKTPLIYNPGLELVVGFDPGLGGMSFICGQEDLFGRMLVLGELIVKGKGVQRALVEDFEPYLRRRFPRLERMIIAADPAAGNRAQTDEKTVVDILRRKYTVSIETNNRLPLRLDAIEHYTTRLGDAGPMLLIDEKECPILVRALKGGWRYTVNPKNDMIKGSEPEKNQYSHPGDGFGYLCRYFHRIVERLEKQQARRAAARPRPRRGMYHAR